MLLLYPKISETVSVAWGKPHTSVHIDGHCSCPGFQRMTQRHVRRGTPSHSKVLHAVLLDRVADLGCSPGKYLPHLQRYQIQAAVTVKQVSDDLPGILT